MVKPKGLVIEGCIHYDVSGARPIIGKLVNAAHDGSPVVINSSKGRAAALVSLRALKYLQHAGVIHMQPDTMSPLPPRNDTPADAELPVEVIAHSRAEALAAEFELPPIEPSDDDDLPDELIEEFYSNVVEE